MRCDEARRKFPDYLTGEGNPGAESVRAHVGSCPECREELEALTATWATLEQMAVTPRERLHTKAVVMKALNRRKIMREVLKAAAILVGVAGLATGAGLYLRPESVRTPAATEFGTGGPHIRGLPAAPIRVVEYGDYECPPCILRGYGDIIDRLLEKYSDSIQYEFRHFPLTGIHPNALSAAKAAEAAGAQGKFWEMHDRLRESYRRWHRSQDAAAIFADLASQLGLDSEQFQRSFESIRVDRIVRRDMDLGRADGVEGVPAFVLDGRKLGAAPASLEEFEVLIGDAVRKANADQVAPHP